MPVSAAIPQPVEGGFHAIGLRLRPQGAVSLRPSFLTPKAEACYSPGPALSRKDVASAVWGKMPGKCAPRPTLPRSPLLFSLFSILPVLRWLSPLSWAFPGCLPEACSTALLAAPLLSPGPAVSLSSSSKPVALRARKDPP